MSPMDRALGAAIGGAAGAGFGYAAGGNRKSAARGAAAGAAAGLLMGGGGSSSGRGQPQPDGVTQCQSRLHVDSAGRRTMEEDCGASITRPGYRAW